MPRMRWFQHDSRMTHDLAVARLSDRAFRDWIRVLELCAYHETDGFFTEFEAKTEKIRTSSVSQMVAEGLVKVVAGGHANGDGNRYEVSTWKSHQRSQSQIDAKRAATRDRRAQGRFA